MIVSMWSHYEGSPPHLRGKRLSYCSCVSSSGITPAPAGKTNQGTPVYIRLRDHPRTCGENRFHWGALVQIRGSPPHLRGKLKCIAEVCDICGITPAPAGKTAFFYRFISYSEDHPRTCGENRLSLSEKEGKRRITPAPAGKTPCLHLALINIKDHPRTCGENTLLSAILFMYIGSPPHLRGKPSLIYILKNPFRITPAPAGKTLKNDVDTL